MGNSLSNNCDDMQVVMEYPVKTELKFIESNVSHAGYKIYRFKVSGNHKMNHHFYKFNVIFKNKKFSKDFNIFKPNLDKNILGTDQIFYNTKKKELSKGTIHLRLDNEYYFENVIIEINYQDLEKLNKCYK